MRNLSGSPRRPPVDPRGPGRPGRLPPPVSSRFCSSSNQLHPSSARDQTALTSGEPWVTHCCRYGFGQTREPRCRFAQRSRGSRERFNRLGRRPAITGMVAPQGPGGAGAAVRAPRARDRAAYRDRHPLPIHVKRRCRIRLQAVLPGPCFRIDYFLARYANMLHRPTNVSTASHGRRLSSGHGVLRMWANDIRSLLVEPRLTIVSIIVAPFRYTGGSQLNLVHFSTPTAHRLGGLGPRRSVRVDVRRSAPYVRRQWP